MKKLVSIAVAMLAVVGVGCDDCDDGYDGDSNTTIVVITNDTAVVTNTTIVNVDVDSDDNSRPQPVVVNNEVDVDVAPRPTPPPPTPNPPPPPPQVENHITVENNSSHVVTVNGLSMAVGASHDWQTPVTIVYDTLAGFNSPERPVPADGYNYRGTISNDPGNTNRVLMYIDRE